MLQKRERIPPTVVSKMSTIKKTKILSKSVSDQDNSPVPTPINHWLRLSDEMVLSILRLLSKEDLGKVSLLNKKFRDLSRDNSLWTELTLDYQDIKQNAESCRKLVERCKKLASLKITNRSHIPNSLNIMTVVIRAKDSLTSLDVDSSLQNWTYAAMDELGLMKGLKNISFTFNARYPQHPQGLSKLAQLDQLEGLKIDIRTNAYGTGLSFMKNVLKQLKQLKTVELTNANSEMLAALANNNPGLKVLEVLNNSNFDDEIIYALSDKCPDLEELKLNFLVREPVPAKFSFPNMKYLDIKLYTYYTYKENDVYETMIGIIENLKCLRSFNLRGFYTGAEKATDSLFQRIQNQYPELNFAF